MSHTGRLPTRRHPLCTCPNWTPDFQGTPDPDRTACRGGTIAHPPPLDSAAMRELLDAWAGGDRFTVPGRVDLTAEEADL